MDNKIVITLKDSKKQINFESNPTLFELVATKLIIEEVIEHNFHKSEVYETLHHVYNLISDVEEVIRT